MHENSVNEADVEEDIVMQDVADSISDTFEDFLDGALEKRCALTCAPSENLLNLGRDLIWTASEVAERQHNATFSPTGAPLDRPE